MKQLLRFKTFLLMAVLSILAGTSAWAQSDYSDMYTSNVALPSSGTNVSSCKVVINGTQYDGTKLGKSKTGASASITVPAGTKYIHLHVAAWNGKTPGFSYTVGSGTAQTISGITSDTGIANNSPFTFSGDPSSTDYYKVITLESALTAETSITLACTSERVVFWGVNTEEESGSGGDTSVATTVTIDASGITNTDVYAGTDAGSLTATVSTDEGAISGAIVTWSGNNDAVATIDASTGAVTLVAAGSVTFTASYAGVENTYKPSSKTYVMTVTNNDPTIPGTENNPYTVAQARAAIDAGTGLTGVYATGIVSAIPTAYNSQYSNITFNFVDNDGDTDFLQAYRCGGTDAADVQVGDIVVVYGNLTKYGSTYEFGQGCEVVSVTHPAVAVAAPTFSPAVGAYTEPQNVTISCATDGADIYYTTDGTEPDVNSTLYTGAINVATTTTIKAIAYKGGESSTVAKATYHITSVDNPYTVSQALGFDDSEYPIEQIYVHGIVSTAPTQAPTSNGQLTYYISDDGTTTNQLQVYKGQGLNAVEFTSQDDIQVGDEVTIIGNVKIYNNAKEFDTGNYLVAFNRPVVATPSITVNIPNPADVNADGGDNEFEVTYTNLAADPQLAVVFCDANGDAVADGTYNWITATYNATSGKIDGHIDVNTGDARTAYFKVSGKDANDNTVYSELITINQSAYNPSINIKTEGAIEFAATGGEKTLGIDYESLGSNPTFQLQFFEQDGVTETQCGWILYQFDPNDNKVTITGLNNDENAARTAYFKVYAEVNKTNIYSNLVTVNQAAPAAPVTGDNYELYSGALTEGDYIIYFDGKAMNTTVTSDRLQYEEVTPVNDVITTDNAAIVWHIAPSSDYWTIYNADAKAYAASTGAKNKAQMLDDGTDDKALWTVSGTDTYEFTNKQNAANNVNAYLRNNGTYGFACYAATTGGTLSLYKKSSSPAPTTPSITLPDGYDYTMDAKAGGGELTVTCSNMPADPKLEVLFYESDGTTSATYTWISAYINSNGNIYGQIQENTGAARTAYFKVHGVDADNNDVYSNLVTFTQEAPVAATPTIVFNPNSIDFDAKGDSRTIGGDYFKLEDFDSTPSLEILYYESDGYTEKQGGYDWLTANVNTEGKIELAYNDNAGAARSAYLKLHAVGTTVYSNLFTVNQAAANVAHYYQKVTADADLTDGQYLIVYEEGTVAFDGGLSTLDATSNTIDVTIVGDKIEGNSTTDAATFTIDVTAGTLQSASGLYIGQTTDGNGMKASDTEAYTNTISIDADGNAVILASGGAYLRYNATSGQDRFRYFKSSTYTAQKAIQLYKRVEGAMPDYVATPTFDPAAGEVQAGTLVTISTTTANATIRYTTDGSEPTTLYGEEYDKPIVINSAVTIKAIAVDDNWNVSAVAEATYTIATSSQLSPELTLDPKSLNVTEGAANGTVTVTTAAGYNGTITVMVDDPSVADASYDAGVITVVYGHAGSAVISVTAGADGDYVEQMEQISVNVSAPVQPAQAGVVVWSEDWSSFDPASDATPAANGDFTYTYTDGNSATKLYDENSAGSTAPELLINKKGGAFSARIPLYGAYGNMTLKFQTNNKLTKIRAKVDDDTNNDITVDPETNVNGKQVYTLPFTVAEGAKQIVLTFTNNTSSNVRIDNFELLAPQVAVSISAVGYSTMYYASSNLVVPAGVTVSTYKVNSSNITESRQYTEGDVLPKANGYVLNGATGSYTFTATNNDGVADKDNVLRGYEAAALTTGPDAGEYLFYLLGVGSGNKVGFFWGADNGAAFTSGAHKAYLAVPKSIANNIRGFYFDGTVVGIDALNLNIEGNDAYDLQGRRVQQVQKGGLYIINGKKMLAK